MKDFEENYNVFDDEDEISDEEEPEIVTDFIEKLRNLPKDRAIMLNMPRYLEALKSIKKITEIVKEDCPDAKFELSFDGIMNTTLIFIVYLDGLDILNVKAFSEAIKAASTMDIQFHDEDTFSIGFTYRKAGLLVPPENKT